MSSLSPLPTLSNNYAILRKMCEIILFRSMYFIMNRFLKSVYGCRFYEDQVFKNWVVVFLDKY